MRFTHPVLSDGSSRWASIKAGVPQGYIFYTFILFFSSSSFNFYIYDIVQPIYSSIRLFADATSLYIVEENPIMSATLLHSDLTAIHEWASKWHMSFIRPLLEYMYADVV